MKSYKTIVLSIMALTLVACETTSNNTAEMSSTGSASLTEIGKPSAPLSAMQAPALDEVGDKTVYYRKGKETSFEVLVRDKKLITKRIGNGCEYTRPLLQNNLSDLTPSIDWKNCRGSDGHARVSVDGELFPLELGKSVVYSVNGTVTKGSWTGDWSDRRKCKVSDQVRIRTLSGEYDTWKVVCKDKRNKRTFYISPEKGKVVAFKRKHSKDKSRTYTSVYLRKG